MNYEVLKIETVKKLADFKKLQIAYKKLQLEHESLLRQLKKLTEKED